MLKTLRIHIIIFMFTVNTGYSTETFFDSWRNYPMGDYISAITSADFNNDGYVDFAIGPKYTLSNLNIYLNKGDGTFHDATEVYSDSRVNIIGHGDFDGDGWMDLFAVRNNNNDLIIIMNQGDGSFTFQERYTYYGSAGITVMDVNNDGFDDILTMQYPNLHVLFSNGDGTFTVTEEDILILPVSMIGTPLNWDVNHDDYQDLLIWGFKVVYTDSVNYYQQQLIATFVNNGDSTFQPGVEYLYGDASGASIWDFESGYFNSDSEKDVLITDLQNNRVILTNNNDGSFSLAGSFVKNYGRPLKLGDVNGDSFSDIIIPDSENGLLSIRLNNGSDEISFADSINYSGKFTTNPTFRVNLICTDVNNDNYDDIIEYDWTLSPIINHGDGTFPILNTIENMGIDAVDMLADDFNNDGSMDIITIDGHVHLSYNDGNGNFSEAQDLGAVPDGRIFSGHFNDDEIMDFGITGLDGFILYYSQEGGGFQASSAILIDVDGFYSGYGGKTADFNDDGFMDFATYYSGSLMLNILLSDSTGVYHADSYPMFLIVATDISIADIDGDGNLDIATSSHNNNPQNQSGAVCVRLNDGNGQFPTSITMPTEFYANGVDLEDLNNDGYVDIAAVQLAADDCYVSVFLNNGDSTFTETENWAQLYAPNYESIKSADMDGDGDPDLIAINSGYNEVVVLLNEGDGTFPEVHYYAGGDNPVAFAIADFDNDSTMDVAVTSSILDRDFVFMFLNSGIALIPPPPPDTTQIGKIIISEINYHSSPAFDSGDWIEIYNDADSALNLTGWQFLDPTSHIFKFPDNFLLNPGSYYILCKDSIKFKENYPTVENSLGNFNFELGNEGDLIKILNQDDITIDEVAYSNAAPFPVNANGTGYTIELIDLALDNTIGENWTAGDLYGTPGSQYEITNDLNDDNALPKKFSLEQNYPNPFNPKTVIAYQLAAGSYANLGIYNVLGQKVATLVSKRQTAGFYKIEWDASHLSSGIYFYQLKTDNHLFTHKMLLLK